MSRSRCRELSRRATGCSRRSTRRAVRLEALEARSLLAAGLVAAYGFNEGSGPTAADASGGGHAGIISGAAWSVAGRYGGALAFDGVNDWVTIADANDLDLALGMTLEAWVRPSALSGWRTALLKENTTDLAYALYAHDNTPRPAAYLNTTASIGQSAAGTAQLPVNAWSHLAATYDGATLRLYVNATQVGTRALSGSIIATTGALRIGGNAVWGEYFAGLIDEVRIYNRALSQAEIQTDRDTAVDAPPPDTTAPRITSVSPADGASGVATGANITVRFSEAMDASTINAATFELRDPTNALVPAVVSYDVGTGSAILNPTGPLAATPAYFTARIVGGASGVKDLAGNPLAASYSWSFTTGTPDFRDTVAIGGLSDPTTFQFSPDGRVFVAEKSGLIKVFDGPSDPTPTIFADLRTNVHNFWDRGLLGMALDPNFPATPYVYVLYTYDAAIGGTAPRFGSPGGTSDPGPDATGAGAVASARLSRLQAAGNVMTGPEQVLINDWYQQYPSHSVGALRFGPDGALYASAGDGASFGFVDYGQVAGNPPSGDPAGEGGALRSQDLRSPGDPVSLDGTIIRVDPTTGAAAPGNPLSGHADPNARRIIAYGMRNPFRFTFKPGTSELWVGDVGWNTWEEIDRIASPTDAVVENFGWPGYEGNERQSGYDGADLLLLEALYGDPTATTAPFFAYNHSAPVVPGSGEPVGGSSISGLTFYDGGAFPASYAESLFFADYSRNRIYVMFRGPDGNLDTSNRGIFVASGPVELRVGPDGALYYADLNAGAIRRIQYFGSNRPPTAVAIATPTAGPAPLDVSFDGSASSDPDAGDTISFAWDLDDDGQFDDSTSPLATFTYTAPGNHTARLQVTDNQGLSSTTSVVIGVDNSPPAAVIDAPTAALTWRVGDTISFSGHATDPEDGGLPASAMSWTVILYHGSDEGTFHTHTVQTFAGVAAGSFIAPDHEYPSYLVLRFTATDSAGTQATTEVRLDPQTVTLDFRSDPTGLQLTLGSFTAATPFSRTVIAGSTNSIAAPSPQTLGTTSYQFASWSDGGAQAHSIVASDASATYTATYTAAPPPPTGLVAAYGFDEGSGPTAADATGRGHTGTISGAAWSVAGRYGGALAFDGLNDWVTIADANDLDLALGMTLEAWVRPTSAGTWRTVLLKERPGGMAYGLYSHDNGRRPAGYLNTGGADQNARGTSQLASNAWSHLAATYDGATLRLYVNATQVGTRTLTGSIIATAGALRIGGNAVWGEYFAGLIDEVRIYSRALTRAEIQTDMNAPLSGSGASAALGLGLASGGGADSASVAPAAFLPDPIGLALSTAAATTPPSPPWFGASPSATLAAMLARRGAKLATSGRRGPRGG